MNICMVICCVLCCVSILQAVGQFVSLFSRKVVASYTGLFALLFFPVFVPAVFFGLAYGIYSSGADVLGMMLFIIFLQLDLVFVMSVFFSGALIFTNNYIIHFKYGILPKIQRYEDVKGYVMKYSSGIVYGKYGASKVKTYDAEVHFADGSVADLVFRDARNIKAVQLKGHLEDHNCHRNGRNRRKKRGAGKNTPKWLNKILNKLHLR